MNIRCVFAFLAACALVVRAQAQSGNDNPRGPAGDYNGLVTTASGVDPYTGNGRRTIDDLPPVAGSVGAYPLKWSRILATRANANKFGDGGAWRHNYQWSLWVYNRTQTGNGENHYDGPIVQVGYPDGGMVDTEDWSRSPDARDMLGGNASGYTLLLRDGGIVWFEPVPGDPYGENFRARAISDPFGQTTTLQYDSLGRLWRITEPAGRYLELSYRTSSWSYTINGQRRTVTAHLISKVQAFAGPGYPPHDEVSYDYQEIIRNQYTRYYNLTTAYYSDGGVARYTYNPIPSSGIPARIRTCDDVRFPGAMKRVEYEYASPGTWVGKVAKEKNLTTGQTVTEITYPEGRDEGQRTETRPDRATRSFQYQGGELWYYSDFYDRRSYRGYEFAQYPDARYWELFMDARGNIVATERNWYTGGVLNITYRSAPGQPAVVFTYYDENAHRYLRTRTDENGHTTTYTRDPWNRIERIDYPRGPNEPAEYERFGYNHFGQVIWQQQTNGYYVHRVYDNRGLLIKQWNPTTTSSWPPSDAEPHTSFIYYPPGHVWSDRLQTKMLPPNRHGVRATETYEYNRRGQVTKITHSDGTYSQKFYNLDGTLAWEADENHPNASWNESERTRYAYDEYKRVVAATNPLGQTTRKYYDPWNGLGPLSHTTDSVYILTLRSGKSSWSNYDANFRRSVVSEPLEDGTQSSTWFDYDAVGNLTWTQDPRGHVTTHAYDERNRKISTTDPLNRTTQWKYDNVGNKIKETRSDGVTYRTWRYDWMNRLVVASDWRQGGHELDPPPDAAPHERVEYTRDAAGNVLAIKDQKGAIYRYSYDGQNRKTRATYPPDVRRTAPLEEWHYDGAGNLQGYQNPAGHFRHLHFDARNRNTYSFWSNGISNGTPDRTLGQEITTDLDPASRVRSITTNGGETVVSYTYDDANRKRSETQSVAGHASHTIYIDPDADGNRQHVWDDTNRFNATYTYTQRNQLKTITDGNSGFRWFDFAYDPAGNLTERHNWVSQDQRFAYYPDNSVQYVESGPTWGVFARTHYEYDVNGREVATWRDEQQRGEQFRYDFTDQLQRAVYNAENVWGGGTPTNFNRQVSYAYTPDKLNRTSVNDNGGITNYQPPSASGINQYANVNGGMSYDDNFNLTWFQAWGGWSYQYNAQNRLVSASCGVNCNNLSFVYDGLGRILKRTLNGNSSIIVYDNWQPLLEFDGWNNFSAWNLYGPLGMDDIILRVSTQAGVMFYSKDRKGSVMFTFDGNGNGWEKITYDAFGWPTVTDWSGANARTWSAFGNRFMFTGREFYPEMGIYDYRNRWYHPALGRFLQTDPKGFDAGDMNLFRYCGDDPVDRVDPDGLQDRNLDAVVNRPNLTSFGEGDWMQPGSPFTKGEMLTKAREYVAEITTTVNKAVDRANAASRNVKWSASFHNWLRRREYFKNPNHIAETELSTKSTCVTSAGRVASFNVKLQVDINWNASQSAYFRSALSLGANWLGKTGEIEHTRDAARALTYSYGGARPAVDIANEQAASMVGHYMGEDWASARMDAALVDWVRLTKAQSIKDHDLSLEHHY